MDLRFLQMGEVRYEISPHCLLDKLLFEELTVDSGKWTVNVSTAWIYLKYIAEGDTTTVHCQLSTFHCEVSPKERYRALVMSVDTRTRWCEGDRGGTPPNSQFIELLCNRTEKENRQS